MAEETITIFKVNTETAVQSIGDLKQNVKELKKILEDTQTDTEEGWQEYQKTLNELKLNQNALKDAMYATSGSFQDVVDAASGASKSYNSLVHQMASLKEEFRSTGDAARRMELGQRINEINTELKELDALQGNFQRNVGNYESHWKGLAKTTDALDKGFKSMGHGLGGVKNGFDALSASPGVASFSILLAAAVKLAGALKDNDTAMSSLNKGMEALKPVTDFLAGLLEKVAGVLADIIGKVAEFVTNNGIFQKVINGVMGVGNAILQFVIAPFKAVIEAIKVFKEQGISGFRDAAKAFKDEMSNGLAFKSNFQAGQAVADSIMKGVKSKKDEMKADGKKTGEEVGESIAEGIRKAFDKALAEAEKKRKEIMQKEAQELKDILSMIGDDRDEIMESIEDFFEAEARLREMDAKDAKEKAQMKIDALKSVASSTSTILGAMADMYEADEENATRSAEKIKALRIASSMIDTISGAIGAYMQAVGSIPPPAGIIVGAAQAAAVTAAGLANIAKMKSTSMTTNTASVAPSVSMSAPAVQTMIPQTTTITSASDEQRLNDMVKDQKVVLVWDDVQRMDHQSRVQVAESSF